MGRVDDCRVRFCVVVWLLVMVMVSACEMLKCMSSVGVGVMPICWFSEVRCSFLVVLVVVFLGVECVPRVILRVRVSMGVLFCVRVMLRL